MIISKCYNCSLKAEECDSIMLRNFKSLIGLFCVLWACNVAHSQQITAFVQPSKDSVLIGDKITLDIQIKYHKDIMIAGLGFSNYEKILNRRYAADTLNQEKYADLSILDVGNWKGLSGDNIVNVERLNPVLTGDFFVVENKITIAIYNEGTYSIPIPEILGLDSTTTVIPSAGRLVNVYLPSKMQSDSIALNPIQDIMVEKANLSDYKWLLYLIVCLFVIGLLIYYIRNRKSSPKEVIQVTEEHKTAHEIALQALKALESAQLWQQGRIKEYQSELTNIIRHYLEDRYHIKALEMTTDEISTALNTSDFHNKYKDDLLEILQVADLVKFAKAKPSESIHAVFMKKAFDFVENTKEIKPLSNDQKQGDHV